MYKFLLASRYLRTRYIALASIISVTLGVATMIVVNSVMSGFSTQMKDRIHAILSDVMIETTNTDGTPNPEKLMSQVEELVGQHVSAMTPTVEIYGMISFEWGGQTVYRPVTLIGIDPTTKNQVSPIARHMMSRQDIILDGELIRKRLRDPSEPLDWSLTEEAKLNRMFFIDEQRFQQEYGQADHLGGFNNVAQAEATLPDSFLAPDPLQQVDGTESEANFELESGDLTATPDPFGTANNVSKTNPEDPLFARVYVGAGLVSFPYKDRGTGQTKIMYMVKPGEDVTITTIKTGKPEPASFKATVTDLFKSGMSEYDSNLVFCNLEQLQLARGMISSPDPIHPHLNLNWRKGAVTSLQIKLKDYKNAGTVVQTLRDELQNDSGTYQVLTWEQKQGPLLEAVAMESAILNVLLFLIITVAGFGILAIFYMIVVEKTRDIGILKALGASSRGVMFIFLSYGLSLGVVGSGAGVILGLTFVYYINEIEHGLSLLTGRKVFDEAIYYFHEIPTQVQPFMILWVAVGAILIAVLASVMPARRAASLHPVQALRYE